VTMVNGSVSRADRGLADSGRTVRLCGAKLLIIVRLAPRAIV
jgi:hypothetical protein